MRRIIIAVLSVIWAFAAPALAEERVLKMQTIAPSLGQAITMATFANIVTSKLDDVAIEVAKGGAATVHMAELARGNLDFAMTSPVAYNLMSGGKAMYASLPEAPELARNVRLLMWFPYGQFHFAVRGDSDIQTLDDMVDATVFLGPQGGGAYNGAAGWVEATTGLRVGEDYTAIKASFQTGYQAFLDGKIDVYVNGCLNPCGQFLRFTETETLRFIGPESDQGAEVDAFLGQFRYREPIPAGLYRNQVNTGPTLAFNTSVGIIVRADLEDDLIYEITKAFWSNLDAITSDAPWAKALDVEYAPVQRGLLQLHPGAERYYREVGALR